MARSSGLLSIAAYQAPILFPRSSDIPLIIYEPHSEVAAFTTNLAFVADSGFGKAMCIFGTAEPGNSFFPPSLQYYARVPTLGHSLAAAKAELAQSAYPHGFSTSILVPSGNTQYVEAATIIQQELKPLKINVSIQQLDDAAYTAAFEAFNYEAMINGATNDISDPDEMASFQVDVQDGGSHSFWTYYDDPKAIALVREAETEFDSAKRAASVRADTGAGCPGRTLCRTGLPTEYLRVAADVARVRREPRWGIPLRGCLVELGGQPRKPLLSLSRGRRSFRRGQRTPL